MPKNGATGNHPIVPDPDRPPMRRDPRTGLWTKRDTSTGRFVEAKRRGGSLDSVREER